MSYNYDNLNQAFGRILPRYKFLRNQGIMHVEDLEASTLQTIGNPRRIIRQQSLAHPTHASFYNSYCNAIDQCSTYPKTYPHEYLQ